MTNLRKIPVYEPKQYLKDANITVVAVEKEDEGIWQTEYEIEYGCCETRTTLTHKQITRRMSAKSQRCASCGAKEAIRKKRIAEGKAVAEMEARTRRESQEEMVERRHFMPPPPMTRDLAPWEVLER